MRKSIDRRINSLARVDHNEVVEQTHNRRLVEIALAHDDFRNRVKSVRERGMNDEAQNKRRKCHEVFHAFYSRPLVARTAKSFFWFAQVFPFFTSHFSAFSDGGNLTGGKCQVLFAFKLGR